MRKCLSAFAVLIILLFATNVRGQALWHGTEYGMTLEQAKAHVPDAIRPLKPKQRSDGAEELLRLDNVTLVGKHFAASFFFSDGKLKEVSLSLEEGHDFESAMRVFDSLVEDLRAKYGHEIIRQTMKGSFSNTANATWVSRQTTITLFATSVGENDATLNINYQVRAPRRLMTRDLPSNSQVKAGKLGEIIQSILADLKPEAAYFTDDVPLRYKVQTAGGPTCEPYRV